MYQLVDEEKECVICSLGVSDNDLKGRRRMKTKTSLGKKDGKKPSRATKKL